MTFVLGLVIALADVAVKGVGRIVGSPDHPAIAARHIRSSEPMSIGL